LWKSKLKKPEPDAGGRTLAHPPVQCQAVAGYLHYTLSWAESETPSPEHMKETALSSLKALGLEEHEAVLATHHDTQHMHVHIVVNTVHPQTGLTAPLKFTKLDLSKWAEAYEREHGIHCEDRIKNNAERDRAAAARKLGADGLLMAQASPADGVPRVPGPSRDISALEPTAVLMAPGKTAGLDVGVPTVKPSAARILMDAQKDAAAEKPPYVPIKHQVTHRKQWFDRKEITDRMKQMRAALDAASTAKRDSTWQRQTTERAAVDARHDAADTAARAYVRAQYKPRWRNLYSAQKSEDKAVRRISGSLLDRAAYVFQNRERLGVAGKPLTPKEMLLLIRSPQRLLTPLGNIHMQERRALAREATAQTRNLTSRSYAGKWVMTK